LFPRQDHVRACTSIDGVGVGFGVRDARDAATAQLHDAALGSLLKRTSARLELRMLLDVVDGVARSKLGGFLLHPVDLREEVPVAVADRVRVDELHSNGTASVSARMPLGSVPSSPAMPTS